MWNKNLMTPRIYQTRLFQPSDKISNLYEMNEKLHCDQLDFKYFSRASKASFFKRGQL